MKKRPFPSIWAIAIVGLGFHACAPMPVERMPAPIRFENPSHLISCILEQDRCIKNFISSGRIKIKHRGVVPEVKLLIVAGKDPFRIKGEVTHPWGQPILHFLVRENNFQVLDFAEKKVYTGRLGGSSFPALFPMNLEADQLWTLMRGFPSLVHPHHRFSQTGDQILVTDKGGNPILAIFYHPTAFLPLRIQFPGQKGEIRFSGFSKENHAAYAASVDFRDPRSGTLLSYRIDKMVPNPSISDRIFMLDIPDHYERILLPDVTP